MAVHGSAAVETWVLRPRFGFNTSLEVGRKHLTLFSPGDQTSPLPEPLTERTVIIRSPSVAFGERQRHQAGAETASDPRELGTKKDGDPGPSLLIQSIEQPNRALEVACI